MNGAIERILRTIVTHEWILGKRYELATAPMVESANEELALLEKVVEAARVALIGGDLRDIPCMIALQKALAEYDKLRKP